MKGLMLHCGSEIKTREEVFNVPVPQATDSYVPLPYHSFVSRIEKQLAVEGIQIKDEKLALGKNGQRMFGLLQLQLPGFAESDFAPTLGFRNSYDRSCSAGLVVGATVFVCDNLSFSGDLAFQRKHTPNLLRDLQWFITETVSALPAKFAAQSRTFQVYKQTELADKQAHDLIVQLYDKRAINVTDIPYVLKEWREPRHPEFSREGKTAWRLFNAATETIKGDLWRLSDRTQAMHKVLDVECGIETSSIVPVHTMPTEVRN